ncbi:hypothetical protein HN51_043260 [Arachis hypogaea]
MDVTESGPMFLKAVDCADEIKDKDYVAKQIRDVIREVGLSNVVQIVTDNAPLLNVAPTRFASTIVMLKRFRLLKSTDTDAPTLHLVHEMWDSMIKKVKSAIYLYERKDEQESSSFYDVVHSILVQRWTKSSTPFHCLAHSLNPRYYSHQWLREDLTRVSPHQDIEITNERVKCLKRYFPNEEERRKVNIEFASFSDGRGVFDDYDSLNDRGIVDAKSWWLIHGSKAKFLQPIALRLLGQPSSSSCCERNWSTYFFIHSLKRNKLKPNRAENLVFVHTNFRLLSRKTPQYNKGETMMWDIAGDAFSPIDEENGVLEVAHLSLDEPKLERVTFSNDEDINHI